MRKNDFQLLASTLQLLKSGRLEVSTDHTKSLVVTINDNMLDLDFLDLSLFKTTKKKRRKGVLDSLQETRGLGKALADKNITLSLSKKHKAVLKIGKKAKPRFSRIVTRSKEIQVLSLKGLRELDKELQNLG